MTHMLYSEAGWVRGFLQCQHSPNCPLKRVCVHLRVNYTVTKFTSKETDAATAANEPAE